MAYCVSCGVKLASGIQQCPLCNTPVVSSSQIRGEVEHTLFVPAEQTRKEHPKLDKMRKGVVELIITFMAIAAVTLCITGWIHPSFSPYLSLCCTLLGGLYLLVPLFIRPSYVVMASWYVGLTTVLLIIIDLFGGPLSWSLFTTASLVLYWTVGVFLWMKQVHRVIRATVALVSVAVYLIIFNLLLNHNLSWSLNVGLPVYAAVLLMMSLLYLRIRFARPSINDIVLSLISTASIGVVVGNFCYLRSIQSPFYLTWSKSVAIVSLCLLIFMALSATVRKVRHYFHNRVV